MPTTIDLQNVSSQNFQLLVEQDAYDITVRSFNGLSFVSITRNDVLLIDNVKAMPNLEIIQAEYLFNDHGNFIFTSTDDSDAYPTSENYGITTFFQYISKAEVVANAA